MEPMDRFFSILPYVLIIAGLAVLMFDAGSVYFAGQDPLASSFSEMRWVIVTGYVRSLVDPFILFALAAIVRAANLSVARTIG